MLEQQTNAYAVLPEGHWRGYRVPQEPPVPVPDTWGKPTPMPDPVTLARLETDLMGKVMALAADPKADQHVALRRVRLGEHPLLAAPAAGDP